MLRARTILSLIQQWEKRNKKKLTANGVILLTGKQQLGFQTPAIFFFFVLCPCGCVQHLLLFKLHRGNDEWWIWNSHWIHAGSQNNRMLVV